MITVTIWRQHFIGFAIKKVLKVLQKSKHCWRKPMRNRS